MLTTVDLDDIVAFSTGAEAQFCASKFQASRFLVQLVFEGEGKCQEERESELSDRFPVAGWRGGICFEGGCVHICSYTTSVGRWQRLLLPLLSAGGIEEAHCSEMMLEQVRGSLKLTVNLNFSLVPISFSPHVYIAEGPRESFEISSPPFLCWLTPWVCALGRTRNVNGHVSIKYSRHFWMAKWGRDFWLSCCVSEAGKLTRRTLNLPRKYLEFLGRTELYANGSSGQR